MAPPVMILFSAARGSPKNCTGLPTAGYTGAGGPGARRAAENKIIVHGGGFLYTGHPAGVCPGSKAPCLRVLGLLGVSKVLSNFSAQKKLRMVAPGCGFWRLVARQNIRQANANHATQKDDVYIGTRRANGAAAAGKRAKSYDGKYGQGNSPSPRGIHSQNGVGAAVGKTTRTIEYWMWRGWLPYHKFGRAIRFLWSHVNATPARRHHVA